MYKGYEVKKNGTGAMTTTKNGTFIGKNVIGKLDNFHQNHPLNDILTYKGIK